MCVPDDQIWLSLSIIILERSWRWGSMPPTSMAYFSTRRNPGVVLRVPAIKPVKPQVSALSRIFLALEWKWMIRGVKTGQTYLVAIPLHLARMFRATRSPSKRCRALPWTVAICLTGSKYAPSLRCHSTLHEKFNWQREYLYRYEFNKKLRYVTYKQPNCSKTSVKNGHPARMARWFPFPNRNASRSASPTTNPA